MRLRSKISWAVTVLMLLTGTVHGQTAKRKPQKQKPPSPIITLGEMEVGQVGFLTFGEGKGIHTLFPLRAGDIGEDHFVGLTLRGAKVIVRGVKTEGMVSDRYYQLNGAVKVTGTEELSNSVTVFVLEPVDRGTFSLVRSKSPDLEIPR